MVLEGIVPVLIQTPPTTERDSTIATRFLSLEAATAPLVPDGPDPTTTRSYLAALMPSSPGSHRGVSSGSAPLPEATTARLAERWTFHDDFVFNFAVMTIARSSRSE